MRRLPLAFVLFGWMMINASTIPALASTEKVFSYYTAAKKKCCPSEFSEIATEVSKTHCASLCMQPPCKAYAVKAGKCSVCGSPAATSIGTTSYTFERVSYLSGSVDVARGKETESVPHWTSPIDLVGDLAVDGDDSASNYFHSHPSETNPWWVVDLGDTHLVKEVHVMPDGSGIHDVQFRDIEIRVGKAPATGGDFSSWDLLAYYEGPPTTVREYLKFSKDSPLGLCGRYVSIKKIGSNPKVYFAFNEVKVFVLEDDM